MNKHLIAAAVALLAAAGSAQAVTYTYGGNTTGAPTFDRAQPAFDALSLFGRSVNYQTLTFTVSLAGTYDFLSTTTSNRPGTNTLWDTVLFLYSPSFSPTAPLINGLIANDDFTSGSTAGFTFGLVTGTTYVLVTLGVLGVRQNKHADSAVRVPVRKSRAGSFPSRAPSRSGADTASRRRAGRQPSTPSSRTQPPRSGAPPDLPVS